MNLKVYNRVGDAARGARAFTMIEIAIAIGVIGFALVAIIGILPQGLNVQKDNREDTIVNQDANFFMQAIRSGAVMTNDPQFGLMPYAPGLNFLTNYVEAILVSNVASDGTVNTYYYTNTEAGAAHYFPSGGGILGLLTTPHFLAQHVTDTIFPGTNYVRAWVNGLNGSALEQAGANSAVAFRYIMDVQISPFMSFPANVIMTTNDPTRLQKAQFICHNLYEAEFTFRWPILGNGQPGPNRQTFRSTIAGHLSTVGGKFATFYAFQPQSFLTNMYTQQ